jgi:hypothetical protein
MSDSPDGKVKILYMRMMVPAFFEEGGCYSKPTGAAAAR